jgi:hypothetical protein
MGNLGAAHAFVQVMVIVRLTSSAVEDRSVFVTGGTFRAHALRVIGYVTGTLLLLWLAALIAGAVGAGRLPAVPFPAVGALREAPAAHASPQPALRRSLTPVTSGGLVQPRRSAVRSGARERPATSAPGRLRRNAPHSGRPTAPGRRLGSRHPAAGHAGPRAGGQAPSIAPPSPGTAPGATVPAPTPQPAPGHGGASPPVDQPPAPSGRSASPPPSRPVDPPAGGLSAAPSTTRPVEPPAAPPGIARRDATG